MKEDDGVSASKIAADGWGARKSRGGGNKKGPGTPHFEAFGAVPTVPGAGLEPARA